MVGVWNLEYGMEHERTVWSWGVGNGWGQEL